MVTAGNDYYFRICFLDPFQGTVLANFAMEKFQAKTAYLLGEAGNEYDQGLINFFEQAFTAAGGKVIKDAFPTNNSDFNSYLNKAKAEGADVIFTPVSIAYATQIISQAASLGIDIPFLGSDTLDDNMVLEAAKGTDVQLYVSTFYQEGGNPEFDAGIKEYINTASGALEANGGNDTVAAVSAMGYDAYYVALEAIKAADSVDPAAVIPVSLLLVLALTVALGFCIERAAYKPLRSAPRMSVMISAIGVSYLLQNSATYITGGQPMTYPSIPFLSDTISLAGTSIKWVVILTPFLVAALVLVLTQLINHTKVGMAMRAVAKDFETSQLMGIKINSVISVTFVIGSALAAVGSMLYFTTYPAIVPTAGAMPGLKAFVAAVFGGIGSIPGAVIGAFLIGICENFVKIMPFDGATTFVDAFTFALLIIILVFKPTGLFGEKATDKV